MKTPWYLLILPVLIIGLTGCAGTPSEPEVKTEEVEVKDVEVEHADQPVLEYKLKE